MRLLLAACLSCVYALQLSPLTCRASCARTLLVAQLQPGEPGFKREKAKEILCDAGVRGLCDDGATTAVAEQPEEAESGAAWDDVTGRAEVATQAAAETAQMATRVVAETAQTVTQSFVGRFQGVAQADEEGALEALFFSADETSSGSLDRRELGKALNQLGYTLTPNEVDVLFAEHCLNFDAGDAVELVEFKVLMRKLGVRKPDRSLKFAMKLFDKYDADASGTIDKVEFKDLAREIEAETNRRTVLQLASAVVGSLLVAESSSEFLWAQKTFRPLYVERAAEEAQDKVFPTALLSSDLDAAVAGTLAKRGFTASNTILAHSVCSDEVNHKDEQLLDLMVSRWGEGFSLGGLAGIPFAGKSGFRAYLHHVPDNGKLLVMFAPHIGIDAQGRIGALERDGQSAVSKACGAAIGAYKALGAQSAAPAANAVLSISDNNKAEDEPFDPQLQQIVGLLKPKLGGIEDSANDIGFVTYQMYGIVRDLLEASIAQTPDVWDWANEVALVGGIIINRHTGGDFFQPLSFETRYKDGDKVKRVDLFEDAFGKRPDLAPILGRNGISSQVYGVDTLSGLSKGLRSSLPVL